MGSDGIPQRDFLRFGTFAPFFRASERPIAIACFRLFTFPPRPPGPERSVPRFFRRMALATRFDAAAPYRRVRFFFVAIDTAQRKGYASDAMSMTNR
jgi:hypothetical protein